MEIKERGCKKMNEDIIKQIALELNIRVEQVKSTLKMLEDGNTIPFIARYRKEVTGNQLVKFTNTKLIY